MLKRDHAPNFPLKHAQKDMRLALELGNSVGLELATSAAANEEYIKVLDEHGNKDFSAIYEQSTKKRT